MIQVIGNGVIGINYIVFWTSRFAKEKKNILILDSISKILTIIGFILLGKYNGIENAVFSGIRNAGAGAVIKKDIKVRAIVFILFFALMATVFLLDFQGIATLCVLITATLNALGAILLKPQGIRLMSVIGSAFYAGFQLFSHVYFGVVCELITFVVSLASYIKYSEKYENSNHR